MRASGRELISSLNYDDLIKTHIDFFGLAQALKTEPRTSCGKKEIKKKNKRMCRPVPFSKKKNKKSYIYIFRKRNTIAGDYKTVYDFFGWIDVMFS